MVLAAFLLFSALFAVSFWLYHLPVKAVWYPAALCLILGLGLLVLLKNNDFKDTLRIIFILLLISIVSGMAINFFTGFY